MPQTGPKNIPEAKIIAALRKHAGVYLLAAREVGCDRSNIVQRVDRSRRLQKVVQDLDDEIGDIAVGVIKDALLQKDRQMARWYAERRLKDRGFATRTELTGPGGSAIAIAPQKIEVEVRYVDSPAMDAEEEPPI